MPLTGWGNGSRKTINYKQRKKNKQKINLDINQSFNWTVVLNNKWLHPLYKIKPEKFTQRGKLRKKLDGKFTIGTKHLHRAGEVPQKIKDILIGCLLGDASGEKSRQAKTPLFSFKQGIIHADYLYFLYFSFLNWGYTSSNVPIPLLTKDSKGKTHQYLRFRTLSIPDLAFIYEMFYTEINGVKKKIVPININKFFNPRVLAYWIMDDGSWAKSGILLHSNNFTLCEVECLVKLLTEKYNLRITIRKKGKNHIIYIHAESITIVKNLVLKYMHPSFYYKLGINK